MKVLLYANIIVDDALEREPFWETSEQVLLLVEQGQVEGYISASTFGDLYYIIRKARGRDWLLNYLMQLATFCPNCYRVNRDATNMALTANFKDFEDAIQYSTAVINNLDAIIARNAQDFIVTITRILTPQQLIQQLINP